MNKKCTEILKELEQQGKIKVNHDFEFPEPIPLEKKLKDMLEDNVDEKYYLSDDKVLQLKIKEKDISNTVRTGGRGSLDRHQWDMVKVVGNLDIKGHDQIKRVYDKDGVSPTITTMDGGNRQPKIIDDYNGNIRKDQETIGTLTTNCGVSAPRNGWKIAEPFCVASRGRGENNEQHLEPRMDGNTNTITSVQKDNYVAIRTANKQGFDLATEGDGIDLQYPTSTTRRGRVGHEVSKTIMTGDGMGVVVKSNLKTDLCNKLVEGGIVKGGEVVNHSYTTSQQRNTLDKYIESNNGVMPTLTTRPDCFGYATLPPNIRIRKLTPKECWRLMGFDDSDFEKAEKVNSNAQLYKQAGNSIVVNVLEAIFKNLL